MSRYIAVKDKRNQSNARDYCSSTKLNGTLCSFHNHFDWQKIVDLIKTVEYNEISLTRYWTGLTLDKRNGLVFMNGEDAEFAKGLNIAGNLSSECVVASRSGLQSWPCNKEEYFICDTAREYNNTEGISYVKSKL